MKLRNWALALLLTATPLQSNAQVQIDFDPSRPEVTREDLADLIRTYDDVIASTAYSESLKAQARERLQEVRQRLELGDFRTGDRVVLSVQGENLPDTVPVGPGPAITLPLFGAISLGGVLRSELEQHLTTELGRFIREPVVQAQALMRVTVQGAVSAPGFFWVPGEILVDDVLMLAGGPTTEAKLEELRVERANDPLWEGTALADAMRRGWTLDQLNLRAGDQIVLPQDGGGGGFSVGLGFVATLVGIATSLAVLAGG